MAKEKKIGLVDMHNHMLFGVDDGARTKEESLKLLEIAYADGIRTVIFTPHHHPRRGMADYADIFDNYHIIKDAARRIFPDMALYLGRETFYLSNMLEEEEKMEELSMCGTRIVLIEFSSACDERTLLSAVDNLSIEGYIPVVAHVERYACTIKNPDIVRVLKSKGAYIQINADSVMKGRFAVKQMCKKLIKSGFVDFVATDAHDTEDRKPVLNACYEYIAKKFGENTANRLMCDNPMRIVNDELD